MSTQSKRTGLRAALAAAAVLSASACSSDVSQGGAPKVPSPVFEHRSGGHFLRPPTDDELVLKREPDQISVESWADIYRDSVSPNTDVVARTPIVSTDTHVCFLSGVQGDLYRGAEVNLSHWVDGQGRRSWMLAAPVGISGANSSMGEAVCVPWDSFVTVGDGFVWYSDPVSANAGSGCLGRSKEVTVAPDDWGVGFLTKVYGQFEGGEEYARLLHSTSGARPLTLRVHTKQCGPMGATAREFIAASGSDKTRRSGPFEVSSSGTKRQVLIPTRDGVCFLSKVSGNMDGSPESVRILPEFINGFEMWVIEARAGGGSAYGTAQCVHYTQFTDPTIPI